jgi:hypothetical protein
MAPQKTGGLSLMYLRLLLPEMVITDISIKTPKIASNTLKGELMPIKNPHYLTPYLKLTQSRMQK